MRVAWCAILILGLVASSGWTPQRTAEPFVPIGVWYGGGTVRAPMVSRNPASERADWRRDLTTIKSLGFNSVKTWVDWASAEPVRGRYQLAALEQLLSLADETGLRVIVQIYTDAAPEWLASR
jgi:beta-galactosidase